MISLRESLAFYFSYFTMVLLFERRLVKDSNTIAAISVARDSDIFSGQALNEIVLTGYTATRKKDMTSSSAPISKPADRREALAGKVAGVMIRGTNSVGQVNDTLSDTQ